MSQPLTRKPTQAEFERAKELALVLADIVMIEDTATAIGAVGLLIEGLFLKTMKQQYILTGFDDFAKHTRNSIEKELRRAHH